MLISLIWTTLPRSHKIIFVSCSGFMNTYLIITLNYSSRSTSVGLTLAAEVIERFNGQLKDRLKWLMGSVKIVLAWTIHLKWSVSESQYSNCLKGYFSFALHILPGCLASSSSCIIFFYNYWQLGLCRESSKDLPSPPSTSRRLKSMGD